MQITEQKDNNVSVFVLQGRIDTEGAIELDTTLQAAVDKGNHNIVLDMTKVDYISSAGLRTLADILTRNRDAGGDLKLASLNRKVLRVLRIIGFDKFFMAFDTLEAAVAAFQD